MVILRYLLPNHRDIQSALYLKVEVHPKLLISQSKFSGPRKYTLRYQWFELAGVEI